MNKTYTETFAVRATDCDFERRMRLDALFVAMQEGGERHALALGAGYDQMMARGLFFALARIHVSTLRAPRQGETVVHTTWPGETNREWGRPMVMDPAVKARVDALWGELGL